jgi:hypothetical protein
MSPAQLDRGPKWTADEDHKMLEMVNAGIMGSDRGKA